MTVLVTVRFEGSHIDTFNKVGDENPHLKEQINQIASKHGSLSHRRVVSTSGEVMDIDEWESEEGLRRFQAEAEPVLREMSRLRGIAMPVDVVWYPEQR